MAKMFMWVISRVVIGKDMFQLGKMEKQMARYLLVKVVLKHWVPKKEKKNNKMYPNGENIGK